MVDFIVHAIVHKPDLLSMCNTAKADGLQHEEWLGKLFKQISNRCREREGGEMQK
jgi:ribosomal protein L17